MIGGRALFHHMTVMKKEAIEGLQVKPDGVYVDCTLGGAGHSEQIARKLGVNGRLIALDQDDAALQEGQKRLAPFSDRVTFVKSNFRALKSVLNQLGIRSNAQGDPQVDGILFDLGVSSPQLDEAERGFSYKLDAPLDMRMDQRQPLTARMVVNEWTEQRLVEIFFQYGEEKFAKRIARHISTERAKTPIETTLQLADMIKQAIPAAARRTGPHPAKRTFQAIRIAVNDELGAFAEALEAGIACLQSGGRLSVITFHSLEDRICKKTFQSYMQSCTCPPDFPMCVCKRKPVLKLVQRKPLVPDHDELEQNPRARSAKLRIAEKY